MSLIYDALKKTEGKTGQDSSGSAPLGGKSSPKSGGSSQVRIGILVGIAVMAAGAVGYFRFYLPHQQKQQASVLMPKAAIVPQLSTKEALWDLSATILANEDWTQGQQVFQRLILIDPTNPEAYNNLGIVFKKLGRSKEAYRQYEKALAIKPDYPEALNNLGTLLLNDFRLSEAKVKLERAIELKTDYVDPYFNLGVILEAQGDHKSAMRHYENFLSLAKDIDSNLRFKIKQRVKMLEHRL
jgi:Flp pilus assembly protein TadD